jgi:hypothetical protein
MFREMNTKRLTDYRTGKTVGFYVHIGCQDFYVDNEADTRKLVVAYANDPEGVERDAYARWERNGDGSRMTADGPVRELPPSADVGNDTVRSSI